MKRARFEVDPLQRKHRLLIRRQRAKHALQRLEMDGEYARFSAARDREARAQERVCEIQARMKDAGERKGAVGADIRTAGGDKSEIEPASLAAALADARAEHDIAAAAARSAGASMRVHTERAHYMAQKHAREAAALVYKVSAELKGRVLIAEANAAEVKAAAASAAQEGGEESAAAGGEESDDGSGSATKDGKDRQKEKEARAAREAAERERRDRIVLGSIDYATAAVCSRCGTHVTRTPPFMTCSECKRELCGRGGISIWQPAALPCIDIYKCHCGSNLCHDCYVAGEQRGSSFWRPCAMCEAWMCSKEREVKAAECKRCGLEPLCRNCRGPHETWCQDANVSDEDEDDYDSDDD